MKHFTVCCLVLLTALPGLHASEFLDAASAGNVEKLKSLLQANPKLINEVGGNRNTALHLAAESGRKDAVEFLLEKGADPKVFNTWNNSPWHCITENDAKAVHVAIAEMFLKKGLEIDLKGHADQTLLHLARSKELAAFLIEKGANVNAKSSQGESPLYYYCYDTKELDILKLLIEKGADVNATNYRNETPLHKAVSRGATKVTEYLIEHGARPSLNTRDTNGRIPLDLASDSKLNFENVKQRAEIAKYLKSLPPTAANAAAAGAAPAADDAGWTKQGNVEFKWEDEKTLLARTMVSGQWLSAVVKSYVAKKEGVTLNLLTVKSRQMRVGKDTGQVPVTWRIPLVKQENLRIKLQSREGTSKEVFATPYQVNLKDPLYVNGELTKLVRANFVHYSAKAQSYLIFPMAAKPLNDIDMLPLWIPESGVASILHGTEAIWQHDERCALAQLGPSLDTIASIRPAARIKVPAMEQDYSCGCVLNGYKIAFECLGRSTTSKELMTKLGVTAEMIKGKGIPWTWTDTTDGDVYKKLQIDQAAIFSFTEDESLECASQFLQDFRFGFGTRLAATASNPPGANWLMHGLMKVYLAKGLPVLVSLYGNAKLSHMVAVLGYDDDKKAYYVNYGVSKELERITYAILDRDWSRIAYRMIVLSQNADPIPLPERKYTMNAQTLSVGVLKAAADLDGKYVLLQEDEFSNGIYLKATPTLLSMVGRRMKLSGTAIEETVKLKDGEVKLIVMQGMKIEK